MLHSDHQAERRVTWIELFFDLVFVAAVSQVGAPLGGGYAFHALGRYAFLLLVIWWAWHGYAVYATRFHGDTARDRLLTILQMVAVIFMAANAEDRLDSESSAGFAAAYALMRIILVAQYLAVPAGSAARRLAREHAAGFGLAALMWLVSAVAPLPVRYGLWAAALAIDLGTAAVASRHTLMSPPHAAHLPERFGLFTLILLGEAIVAIMKGIQAQGEWSPAAACSALAGITLVCGYWWGYFEMAAATAHRRLRSASDWRRFEAWNYLHLPLYLGLALTGVGVEHMVVVGGAHHLHGEEIGVLGVAVALATSMLTALAMTKSKPSKDAVTIWPVTQGEVS